MNTMNADAPTIEFLSRLAHKTLQSACVGLVNGTSIYQIGEGWEHEVLLAEGNVTAVHNSTELEAAVQSPDTCTILVPLNASLTQEVTERILQRNPLSKIILWEVTS